MAIIVNNYLLFHTILKSEAKASFFCYNFFMLKNGEKLGAFIVPTGIAASIGGFAGDASCYARKFSNFSRLIVNPNVVNAGCFSGITENMLYVEGYSLDSFFKKEISLVESKNNNIGIIFDKAIPDDVLNIHINTVNAVKMVYDVNISNHVVTDEDVGVEFIVNKFGISCGNVKNIETLKKSAEYLLNQGCDAIAICCLFDDSNDENYAQNGGVDPIGGVEAIISHFISKEFRVPCAHSPAFCDYQILPDIVDKRASAEYITPTFLPCILIGLSNAPKISNYSKNNISMDNLDYVVMPYNSLGSVPVFEALKNGIKVFAIRENDTILNISCDNLFKNSGIIVLDTYEEALEQVKKI